MYEAVAVFIVAGFAVMAMSGKMIYRGYARLCRKLSALAGLPEAERGPRKIEPVAMVLTGFSLCMVFILLIMAYTAAVMALPINIGSVLVVGMLMLMFDNLFVLVGYWFSRQAEREKLSQQLLIQKERTEISYYSTLEEQYDRQRVLIHDIRKHLSAIRDLSVVSGDQAVEEYVRELELLPALQHKVRICHNHTLDVVLSRYKEICEGEGIAFAADVREGSADSLEQSDITALFGNLLENAVESARSAAPLGSAPYVELRVEGHRPGGAVVISLVNTCLAPPAADGSGGWISQKSLDSAQGIQHGLGLKSVRATVKKYGGTIRQYYSVDDQAFHTIIYLK